MKSSRDWNSDVIIIFVGLPLISRDYFKAIWQTLATRVSHLFQNIKFSSSEMSQREKRPQAKFTYTIFVGEKKASRLYCRMWARDTKIHIILCWTWHNDVCVLPEARKPYRNSRRIFCFTKARNTHMTSKLSKLSLTVVAYNKSEFSSGKPIETRVSRKRVKSFITEGFHNFFSCHCNADLLLPIVLF